MATSNTKIPAGSSRNPAINRGVVCAVTPFIATIAVPQKKKGEIGRMDDQIVLGFLRFDSIKFV
jgi:hypothetical protein